MSTEPLPTTLDVRKAAAREVTVSGVLALAKLTRLEGVLASDSGHVEATIAFGRDEEKSFVATISVAANVEVRCQRCLDIMPIVVATENRLAIVADDDQARSVPSHMEPWVVEGEQGSLWTLVEDELILGIPIVSYHDSEECKQILKEYQQPPPESVEVEENPFKVLEQLKPGNK
jgi:uncharacterized protein